VFTLGIDLAAQPKNTGAVLLEWSDAGSTVVEAGVGYDDDRLLDLASRAFDGGGRVGLDCPLGWPASFVRFVTGHAAGESSVDDSQDTRQLRLRHTDLAVHARLGLTPLSVSTNMLGITAFRAARLQSMLKKAGLPADRGGEGFLVEVYPAASRRAWFLAKQRDLQEIEAVLPLSMTEDYRKALESEHVFDGLIAALTARAAALGATDAPPAEHKADAAAEGWIHLPRVGHALSQLSQRVG
jgi:predicted nuclease with RNAse H fold